MLTIGPEGLINQSLNLTVTKQRCNHGETSLLSQSFMISDNFMMKPFCVIVTWGIAVSVKIFFNDMTMMQASKKLIIPFFLFVKENQIQNYLSEG
jgi:hypothetical protein